MAYHSCAFLGLLVLCALSFVNGKFSRIIGGSFAREKEFQFIVSIRYYGDHFCGGTIISNQHILTAAHCFKGRIIPPYLGVTVVSGTTSLLRGGQSHKIINAIRHPGYTDRPDMSIPNDIAILTLKRPMSFNIFQQPIKLVERPVYEETVGVVSGWGYHDVRTNDVSPDLKKLNVEIISSATCIRYLGVEMYYEQLCGIQTSGQGVCSGDSGGPLIVNEEVVGVVSWVAGLCGTGLPDVYTNVYKYRDFIRQNTQFY